MLPERLKDWLDDKLYPVLSLTRPAVTAPPLTESWFVPVPLVTMAANGIVSHNAKQAVARIGPGAGRGEPIAQRVEVGCEPGPAERVPAARGRVRCRSRACGDCRRRVGVGGDVPKRGEQELGVRRASRGRPCNQSPRSLRSR